MLTIMTLVFATRSATVQSEGGILVDACNDDAYPRIYCDVAPLSHLGLPMAGLDAGAFSIEQGAIVQPSLSVTTLGDPAVRLSTLLVIDTGQEARAAYSLVRSADYALDLAEEADHTMLMLASQTANDAGLSRADRRSRVRALSVQRGAPLFDTLCAAADLLGEAAATATARVLIVVGDGRDSRSSQCGEDHALMRIGAARIPVLAIATVRDADARFLQRLATHSGGEYVSARSGETVRAAFAALRHRITARYRVVFNADSPFLAFHQNATLHVAAGGRTMSTRVRFTAAPVRPRVLDLRVVRARDRQALSAEALPANTDVVLLPNLAGRTISGVVYDLNGVTYLAEHAPYGLTLSSAMMSETTPSAVLVRALGPDPVRDHDGTGFVLQLALAGSEASRQLGIRHPSTETAANPVRVDGVGGPIAVALMGMTLIAGGWLSWKAQRRVQRQPVASALQRVLSPDPLQSGALARSRDITAFAPPRLHTDAPTLRAGAFDVASGAPLGRIQVAGGRDYVLSAGSMPIAVGRAASRPHDIALESAFVSARHAQITVHDGELHVTDLGSSNGTRRNGNALTPHVAERVQPGDEIACADVILRVC
jgi:hypothetical protein